MKIRRISRFRVKASSLVEFAAVLVLLFPLFFLCSDFFMLVFGSQVNDSVCQDAARVASIGDPSTAKIRAAAIIARANQDSSRNSLRFKLVSVTNTSNSATTPGNSVEGSVTVETSVQLSTHLIRWFYTGRDGVTVKARQTFPFTYVMPSTTNSP